MDTEVPPEKIVLGISTYGRAYWLQDATKNDFQDPADTEKDLVKGEYAKLKGTLAKYEICDMKWTNTVTENRAEAPYSYNVENKIWVGYDDKVSIERKINCLVIPEKLGGVGVWTLGLDDFSGKYCGKNKFPLITAMKNALKESSTTPDCDIDDVYG